MIRTQAHGEVTLIEIDRDEARNALDVPHLHDLAAAVRDAIAARQRVVVINGRGRAFSSGADINGVYGADFRTALYVALDRITSAPVPVIAAVGGPAVGAGAQLALACDLRVAAEGAFFSVPTATNGLAVDPWTVRRLALLAGGGGARHLLLGAGRIDRDLALQRGLVDRAGDLTDALDWARDIAGYAPLSLQYSKRALELLAEPRPWPAELDRLFDECWASTDVLEARQARAAGRAPAFQGR